ncbi:protein of unknown function [Legionella longbeachae NSW150]|uniref:Uncharacterized protein n=1 Tax=Legionella longbeachae serogroup 1 (strain NSW150) TaxID=661367 RepID=D3HIY1_LEGLN|nr:protein of unknown function [Legionella longbeachae NSW150]
MYCLPLKIKLIKAEVMIHLTIAIINTIFILQFKIYYDFIFFDFFKELYLDFPLVIVSNICQLLNH